MKLRILISLLVTFAAFSACKKQESNPPLPYNSNQNNNAVTVSAAYDIFKTTAYTPQKYTIDASQQATVKGNKGTRLFIAPNSFITQGGAPVSGNVDIQLIELYTYNDLLLNNKPTQSNGLPLQTAGSFLITASQDGNELKLAAGKSITGFTRLNDGQKPSGMKLFYGNDNQDGSFDWKEAPDGSMETRDTTIKVDSVTTKQWFSMFNVPDLKWMNCDAYYYMTDKATLNFSAADGYNPGNTLIYVISRNINMVVRPAPTLWGEAWRELSLPPTFTVTVLGISKHDGGVYVSLQKDVKLNPKDNNFKLSFTPSTPEDVKNLMATL